jgi:hypothetical protein
MAEYIDNRTGASGPDSVTKNDPCRTDAVDDAYSSRGFLTGRETTCTICQEEMQPENYTVTHCKCKNSLHEECFNDLTTSSTNLLDTGPKPTKRPLCRGEMKPWPTLGGPISPETEAVRIEAIRAAIEAEEAESSEDSSEKDKFEDDIAAMRARVEAMEEEAEALRDEAEQFAVEVEPEAHEANLRANAAEAAAAAATARFEAFEANLIALQARR